jgi:hypothetical protein
MMQSVRGGVASTSSRSQSSPDWSSSIPQAAFFGSPKQLHKRLQRLERRKDCSLRLSAAAAAAGAATLERVAPGSKLPSLPFVKIADQEDMKLALMLNVIDPSIGGVLIMGDRGTGKSVAVSSSYRTVPACVSTCMPHACLHAPVTVPHACSTEPHRLHLWGILKPCQYLKRKFSLAVPHMVRQVRAMVDLLPEIEVVEGDEFNSHPDDTKLMGPDALQRFQAGEQLPRARIKTPLVCLLRSGPAAAAPRIMHACMLLVPWSSVNHGSTCHAP